jgi:hypothetical protein
MIKKLENNKVANIELIAKEHDKSRKVKFLISGNKSKCTGDLILRLLTL